MSSTILIGDCRDRLKELPDASVDSVVCDPPYHLTSIVKRFGSPTAAPAKVGKTGAFARVSKGFMGQTWDGGDVAFQPETWAEVLRVLKPGGHLIAFSGTRTYHRMVCAIEDAGFEVRDQLAWVYATGFPKSLDVSKQIDKMAGEKGTFGEYKSRDHATKRKHHHERSHEGYQRPWQNDPDACDRTLREYQPATDAAREWQGWGTALKPSWEPICLARKPLAGTVAQNVLTHGTGALNIDGCRIETDDDLNGGTYLGKSAPSTSQVPGNGIAREFFQPPGRWPANLCHDGSEEVLAGFPDSVSTGGQASLGAFRDGKVYGAGRNEVEKRDPGFGDSGSAARFFYTAKATTAERGEGNNHPTVKPVALMRWLVRLVTPKGGTVLDPFMGSGSTLLAAEAEQFNSIGIEMSEEYAAIAERRLKEASGMFAQVEVSRTEPTEAAA